MSHSENIVQTRKATRHFKVIPIRKAVLDDFQRPYANQFALTLQPQKLSEPYGIREPSLIFVNSMSDMFHEDVPFAYIDLVMNVIADTPQHTYQVVTKRAERMAEYFACRTVPDNAWIGVSVEDRKYGVPRIDVLRTVNAKVRWLSIEPLLEDLGELDLRDIHWVVAGGESGHGARAMQPAWVNRVLEHCQAQNVPFHFKQWGQWGADGVKRAGKSANGRLLDGREWNEWPVGYTPPVAK